MGSDPALIEFASRDAVARRLSDYLESVIARAIAERGRAAIALSGGSTPEALYAELSGRPLDWSKVCVTLVDERWTPPGAPGSNESFIRRSFLKDRAAAAQFVGMWSEAPTPLIGAADAERRISQLGEFDAVVLGMGGDGHTASWFPNCCGLEGALSMTGPRVAAIKALKSAVTGDHVDRITLTLGAVAKSRAIALLMVGADKRLTFEQALQEGGVGDMPVRAILRARPDLWACWAP